MVKTLKFWWAKLSHLPFGKWFFSKIVGLLIPYTGTISPRIITLHAGCAEVSITDRRALRNHLRSIHAIALSNLGEFTTGLALHFTMTDDKRAILTRITTEYFKKSRGVITAKANVTLPKEELNGPITVEALLFDAANNMVGKVQAIWLVSKM